MQAPAAPAGISDKLVSQIEALNLAQLQSVEEFLVSRRSDFDGLIYAENRQLLW
jgi:hypothetical protein